jgi:hypothetical protein
VLEERREEGSDGEWVLPRPASEFAQHLPSVCPVMGEEKGGTG